ncbi:MAG TPA: ArsC family reductase [Rubrivivax sp.]|nr:ArsC family reductase [Rubrivivax sp.]
MTRLPEATPPPVNSSAPEAAAAVVHGIPHCDTVKRARAWLQAQGVGYRFHDFKKSGVPPERLDAWIAVLGWEALVNRRGTTWRQLDEAARATVVDAASARALMLAAPSVVKRPVLDGPSGGITVGFDPGRWAELAA